MEKQTKTLFKTYWSMHKLDPQKMRYDNCLVDPSQNREVSQIVHDATVSGQSVAAMRTANWLLDHSAHEADIAAYADLMPGYKPEFDELKISGDKHTFIMGAYRKTLKKMEEEARNPSKPKKNITERLLDEMKQIRENTSREPKTNKTESKDAGA